MSILFPRITAMSAARRAALLATVCIFAQAASALAADKLAPIDVRQVKVSGEIGRRIDVTAHNNLMVLDYDKDFLKPFREKKQKDGYVGLGKTIDALVRMAYHTGDPKLVELKKRVVAETIKCQEKDGYIGLVEPDARVWALWDIHELGYVIYGLSMDHRMFGEKPSLEAARRLADWLIARWTAEPDRKPGGGSITVHMAVTGIESDMLALYAETKDPKYLDFVAKFRKLPEWDAQIVVGRWGPVGGHAYAHICRCIAQLRLARIEPDDRLLKPTQDVMDFITTHNGMVVTGEVGDHECWHTSQSGTINLGETCATAYLVRLLDERLRMTADPLCGDLMERVIHNALFAAQSPDGRKIRYYTPFDGPRLYHQGDTYCCPCNYRRIVAELPGMIYYRTAGARSGSGVMVNLYAPSEATIDLGEELTVKLRQETRYPHDGRVVLHVDPSKPAQFPIALRVPKWCKGPIVSVGADKPERVAVQGRAAVLDRQWKPGDRVTLELPMPVRLVKGRQNQAGCVAVMRGPLVFCLSRERNKLPKDLDLRLLTIDPATLEGPAPDDSFPGAKLAVRVKAWAPGKWYPMAPHDHTLTLTEFPDPSGEATYLHVPNPNAAELVDDELLR